ncbi:MAG: sigma-70 family RNA polymerase sigma factor [Planctomycetota bacterium]
MPLETDLTAANVLVNHLDWLRAIVQSRVSNRSVTDDVLQEVAVAAVKNDQSFDSVEDVKSWLYRVSIRQVALSERRETRQRKKLMKLSESAPTSIDDEYLSRLQSEDSPAEHRKRFDQALAELSEPDRTLLIQRYRESKRCSEIARLNNVVESTIQSRLLRARRRFRKLLQQQSSDPHSQTNP